MSTRRPRNTVPAKIHKIIVDEYEQTGAAPPSNVLSEMTGIDVGAVRGVLRSLLKEGILAQPHGNRGPYVPLIRPDGTPYVSVQSKTLLGVTLPTTVVAALKERLTLQQEATGSGKPLESLIDRAIEDALAQWLNKTEAQAK